MKEHVQGKLWATVAVALLGVASINSAVYLVAKDSRAIPVWLAGLIGVLALGFAAYLLSGLEHGSKKT